MPETTAPSPGLPLRSDGTMNVPPPAARTLVRSVSSIVQFAASTQCPSGQNVERIHVDQDLTGGLLRRPSERDLILREPDGQIGPQSVHDSQREPLAPATGGARVQFMLPDTRKNVGGIEIVRNQHALELQLGPSCGRLMIHRVSAASPST